MRARSCVFCVDHSTSIGSDPVPPDACRNAAHDEFDLGCKRFFESRTDLLDIARLGKYSGLTTLLTIGIEA
jgi:hypothetical protein